MTFHAQHTQQSAPQNHTFSCPVSFQSIIPTIAILLVLLVIVVLHTIILRLCA